MPCRMVPGYSRFLSPSKFEASNRAYFLGAPLIGGLACQMVKGAMPLPRGKLRRGHWP